MKGNLLNHIAKQALIVRKAQQEYFAEGGRTQSKLVTAKQAEKFLDNLLAQFVKQQEAETQAIRKLPLFAMDEEY